MAIRTPNVAVIAKPENFSEKLYGIIDRETDGVLECFVGKSRRFTQAINRFANDSQVRMIVILGGPGGHEEFKISQMINDKPIGKPIVALCFLPFGHYETAEQCEITMARTALWIKNNTLYSAGAIVPGYFHDLLYKLRETFASLSRTSSVSGVVSNVSETKRRRSPWDSQVFGPEVPTPTTPLHVKQFMSMCLPLIEKHAEASDPAVGDSAQGESSIPPVPGQKTMIKWFGQSHNDAAYHLFTAMRGQKTPNWFAHQMATIGISFPGISNSKEDTLYSDENFLMLKRFVSDKTEFPQCTPLLDFAMRVEMMSSVYDKNLYLHSKDLICVILFDIIIHSGMFSSTEIEKSIKHRMLNGRLFSDLI